MWRKAIARFGEELSGRYENDLEKIRDFLEEPKGYVSNFFRLFFDKIDKNHEKGSWVNLAGLGADAVVFAAYRVLSPLVAEYERTDGIRVFSRYAVYAIIIIGIWEFLCLTGSGWLRFLGEAAGGLRQKITDGCRQHFPLFAKICWSAWAAVVIAAVFLLEFFRKFLARMFEGFMQISRKFAGQYPRLVRCGRNVISIAVVSAALAAVCLAAGLWERPETTYYRAVVETYGVPVGLGDSLKEEELDEYAPCWKIEEYKRRGRIKLTYLEPYRSLELMEQYSTVYGMALFKPSARIEISYTKDREKFNNMSQEVFAAARGNGFREAEEISYYSSSGRLTLQLKQNQYGKYDVTHYEARDMPQLYNSTLLRVPEGQTIGNGLAFQQMEVTYNKAGLVEERRLSPSIYNCYGVNGEHYEYDQNKRVSTLYYLDINGEAVCNKLGIMRIDFQYEDNGNLHSIRYYGDEEGTKKIEGFQGVFCEKFSYDSRGRLYERSQQDRNENLRCDRNGVCMYRYEYGKKKESGKENKEGKRVEETFLGFTGEPVQHKQFYDTHVRLDEMRLEDGGYEFCVSTDAFYFPFGVLEEGEKIDSEEQENRSLLPNQAVLREKYDPSERVDSIEWHSRQEGRDDSYGQDGARENPPAAEQYDGLEDQDLFSGQYALWEEQASAASFGNDAWIRVEEESDLACHSASVHYVIEQDGKIHSVSYYDNSGRLMENKAGYARKIFEYDSQGRICREQYQNGKEALCLTSDGYAQAEYVYRSGRSDELESVTYQDVSRHAAINRKLGYSRVEYKEEPAGQGKKIRKTYLDKEGKPIRIPEQEYAIVDQYYNERNFLVGEVYVDEKKAWKEETGEEDADGSTQENGEELEEDQEEDGAKNSKEGKIRRKDYGVAEIRYVYDDRGNLICEFYKDVDGRLVNRLDTGYAMVHRRFQGGQMVHCHYTGYQDRMYDKVIDKMTGVASIEYIYEDGLKTREEYYDVEGALAFHKDTGCAVQEYEYDDGGRICAESYYGTDRKPVLRKDTGCAMVKYQDNENGQHSAVYFYGTDGELILNVRAHSAGISYEYDESDRKATVRYFGTDGGLMEREDCGYAQIEIVYDEGGNVKRAAYLDAKDKPVERRDGGFASYENTYEMGRWVESRYYNEYGGLTERQDTGYAVIRNCYIGFTDGAGDGFVIDDPNRAGLLVSQTFLDRAETPVKSTKYHCAQIQFAYDEQGNRVETGYMDEAGRPALRDDLGYARMRQEYDEAGRCVSVNYYDDLGYPAISRKYGCAGFLYKYDERGNRTDIGYIGKDGEFMVNRDLGYAHLKAEYDELGNRVKEIYLDIDGKPALWKEGGCASREFSYDGRNCVEERYFDEQGKPVPHKDNGYAVVKYQYDGQGRLLSEGYYSVSEHAVWHKQYHCAGRKFAYDEKGRRTDEWYLGTAGGPISRRDLGYAQTHWEYDKFGNQAGESYFDAEGEPVVCIGAGYASCKSVYDGNGNCVERRYLDIHGRPVLRADYGYALVRFQYNELGQCVSEAYYGTREQPVVHMEYCCAGREFAYDGQGNRTENKHTGLDGRPMVHNDLGYAQISSEYDFMGNKVKTTYCDVHGWPVLCKDGGYASCVYRYDSVGNCIEKSYYGTDDQPVRLRKEDYAAARYEYDDLGQCVSVFYFDESGQPVRNSAYSCFGIGYAYDEQGNRTDTWYLDEGGSPMVRENQGYACLHSAYDKLGNEIRAEYRDETGNLTVSLSGGYAYAEYVYDYFYYPYNYDYGNCAAINYYDAEGNSTLRKNGGYASVKYIYDGWGQCILRKYLDCDSRPVINSDYSVALFGYDYDERGNNTRIWYYGEEEELIEREDLGAVMHQWSYDACGRLVSEEYYGFDPGVDMQIRLTPCKDQGYAVMEQEFGSPNSPKMTVKRYLDAEGNLAASEEIGYALCELEYDDAGQLAGWAYYDAEGNPASPVGDEVSIVERIYDETGNYIGQTCYDRYRQKIEERSWVSEMDYGQMVIIDRWRQERLKIKIKERN